jgi:hypothetical protein
LEIKHIALWKRECDGGVLLNQNLGGRGKTWRTKNKRIWWKKGIVKKQKEKISEKLLVKIIQDMVLDYLKK